MSAYAYRDEVGNIWASLLSEQEGSARQTHWTCEDGWIVGYSTERVSGGPPDIRGKFVAMAYRPIGKGSRSGDATRWKRVYLRGFAKRKTARARAEALYYAHSPKTAERAGRSA